MSDTTAVVLVSRLVAASLEFLLLGFLLSTLLAAFPKVSPRWRRRIWLLVMFKPICSTILPGFIPLPEAVSNRMLADVMFPEIGPGGAVTLGTAGRIVFQLAAYTYLIGAGFWLLRLYRGVMSNRDLIEESLEKGYMLKPTALRRLDPRLVVPPEVRVIITPEDYGPIALGVRGAAVVIPESLLPWVNQHRDPRPVERARLVQVLRHELAHIAEKHNAAMLVAHVLLSLFWFHPIAHLAFRRLKINSEYCCDERVLESGVRPREYAETLMSIVAGRCVRTELALGMLGDVKPAKVLSSRLQYVLSDFPQRVKERSGVAVAMMVLIGLSMPRFFAPGQPSALPELRFIDGQVVSVDKHGVHTVITGPAAEAFLEQLQLDAAATGGGRLGPGRGLYLDLGDMLLAEQGKSAGDAPAVEDSAEGETLAKVKETEEESKPADAGAGRRSGRRGELFPGSLVDPEEPRSPILPPLRNDNGKN